MTPLDDLDKEATRRQAEFDALLKQIAAKAAASPAQPTPEDSKTDGTPDGTPDGTSVASDDILLAAMQSAFAVTVDSVMYSGIDRQDAEPITISFTPRQSQAIRAARQLILAKHPESRDRSVQDFVSDCVASLMRSDIKRSIKGILDSVSVVDLPHTDEDKDAD